jgi:hypothetical protein
MRCFDDVHDLNQFKRSTNQFKRSTNQFKRSMIQFKRSMIQFKRGWRRRKASTETIWEEAPGWSYAARWLILRSHPAAHPRSG